MARRFRTAMAVAGVCLSGHFASIARAIDAVYNGGVFATGDNTDGGIEVQGFNGRMLLPTVIPGPVSTFNNSMDSIVGVTANDNLLYTLLANSGTPNVSTISENDTHSGSYIGSIQLAGNFSDIAYTNGQLYGLQSIESGVNNSIEIDSIGADGSITPLVTKSTNAGQLTNWRLSGAVNGDSLFAIPAGTSGSATGYEFTPTAPASLTAVTVPSFVNRTSDTVINAAGSSVVYISGTQYNYSYPALALQSITTQSAYKYGGSKSVSDEFNYTYNSSQPAYATLAGGGLNFNNSNPDGLYRSAQVMTGTSSVQLINGVAPDGATVSNVVANNLFQQTEGTPLPIQIQETDAPAGSFSQRTLATAVVSIDLTKAGRGIYGFGNDKNVTADYTVGNDLQPDRPVSVNINSGEFAYDPPSSNLVGNGDGSLNGFGWETVDVNSGAVSHGYGGISSIGLGVTATKGDPESLQQVLLLPTASGPMMLSFEYEAVLSLNGPTDLSVSLDGVELTTVLVSSGTPEEFEMMIDNPALEGVTDADLTFTATVDSAATSTLTWVGLGDISLTAVPEPSTMVLLGSVVIGRLARRPKRLVVR